VPPISSRRYPARRPHAHDRHLSSAILIVRAGDQAGWRYVEFFTANIHNPNTRRAYARACALFFAWCEARQLALTTIRPVYVATWVEQLQQKLSAGRQAAACSHADAV
jgi:hypothetical protein